MWRIVVVGPYADFHAINGGNALACLKYGSIVRNNAVREQIGEKPRTEFEFLVLTTFTRHSLYPPENLGHIFTFPHSPFWVRIACCV
jgi:hypothetical protein